MQGHIHRERLSLGPRDAVGGNTATVWSLGYCRCPGLGRGGFALKRSIIVTTLLC